MENIFNLLFPTKCIFCKKNIGIFCDSCIQKAEQITFQVCIICERPSVKGETHVLCSYSKKSPNTFYSPFIYKGITISCIRNAKYEARLFFPLKILVKRAIKDMHDFFQADYILIPVPISKSKLKERGFNQADVIASVIAEEYGLVIQKDILLRIKATTSQFLLTRQERALNVKNAFFVKNLVKGKKIILIDDVCTTGATFLECSRILYAAGAEQVSCFALAKSFLRKQRNAL